FGFIESPYRKVKDGRVTDYVIVTNAAGSKYKAGDIVEADEMVNEEGKSKKKGVEVEPYSFYLSAWEEDQYVIAQANASVDAGLAHPVPRERRCEPRPDGIEHAAPGRAAAQGARALCRHRHGIHHRPRLRRRHRGAPVGLGGLRRQPAHRRPRRERDRRRQGDGR